MNSVKDTVSKFMLASILLTSASLTTDAVESTAKIESKKDARTIVMAEQQMLSKMMVTEEEVGDVDSFGRKVKWAGVGQTEGLSVDAACVPGPGVRCLTPSDTGTFESFDERDLEKIVLPGKTAKSLICHSISPFWTYQTFNNSGFDSSSQVFLSVYITVENDVLNDPSIVDPVTGLPVGGAIEYSLAMSHLEEENLLAGQGAFIRNVYTRNCISGLISQRFLKSVYGLTDDQAKKFFKKDTTIRFHLRGSHNLVSFASFFYGIRLTTD